MTKNQTYTETKLSRTGVAAAHKVSTLANKALPIIPDPGPQGSLTFSFKNAFAIIVPGKCTVAFDSPDFSSSRIESLRWGDERLNKRGEYFSGFDVPPGPSPVLSGMSGNDSKQNVN